jgi:hypothetical protein
VIGAVANRLDRSAATLKEDVMNEKDIRLAEVKGLQDHCDGHGVGTGNPEHTIRLYITRRIEQIEREFSPKPAAAPAYGTPAESPSKFVAGKPTADRPEMPNRPGMPMANRQTTPTKSFVAGK